MRDFFAGCNGLLRDTPIDHTADAVGEGLRLVQVPVPGGWAAKDGDARTCHDRQKVYHDFVNEAVKEKASQEVHTWEVGHFGDIDAGIAGTPLVTDQIQHRMSGVEPEGAPLQPVRESLGRGLHPPHEIPTRFRKEAVEGHRCHYLHFCHIRLPLPQKESVAVTHSDSGSGKPKREYATPRYADA